MRCLQLALHVERAVDVPRLKEDAAEGQQLCASPCHRRSCSASTRAIVAVGYGAAVVAASRQRFVDEGQELLRRRAFGERSPIDIGR